MRPFSVVMLCFLIFGLNTSVWGQDSTATPPPIREYYPGEKPYKMVYVQDPFGIVFEIYTHSYELTYSSGAYQDQ